MGYLAEEIENAALELGISFFKIDKNSSLKIKEKLACKFTNEKKSPQNLSWQNLKDFKSVHNVNGWKLIKNYVQKKKPILFVSPLEEEEMWRFNNGEDLVQVINNCIGFPFCVTSDEANYIICFDDHDCLIGVGSALEWLKNIPQELNRS